MFERMIRKASERNWSQTDLAKRIGVSPQNITNWKARGVPSDQYIKLADILRCSLDELLGRTPYISDHSPQILEWPFNVVDESKLRSLPPDDAARIEGAILLVAAQIGVDLKASNKG